MVTDACGRIDKIMPFIPSPWLVIRPGDRTFRAPASTSPENQLDVALAFSLQAPAQLHPVEVAVDVNLQQRRRMVGRPSCHLWLKAAKAELGQVKLIDQHIDRPDRIVLAQIVIQPLRKQSALTAVIANDKGRHPIVRPNRRRIISLKLFSHSLRHKRSFIANAHHASANLAATEPRPAIDASKASPGLTGTIVPRAPDKAISPARNGRFRPASSPVSQGRSVGSLGTWLREVLSSLREA
jgi:hypothetical protein